MCCRCIGASNKALAKRRAAEDALRIIAEKEAAAAAIAVAKQASELQEAIGALGQKDIMSSMMAVKDAAIPEDMADDNAAMPRKPSDKGKMLTTPNVYPENQ